MMLRGSGKKNAESLVTVDENLEDAYNKSGDYKYYFKLYRNYVTYYYYAAKPFYAIKKDDGLLLLAPPNSIVVSKYSTEAFNSTKACKINGTQYNYDKTVRSYSICQSAISNYPILEVTPPTDSSDEIFI